MVKIEIVDYRNVRQLLELEAQLKDRFGLLDVKVVDCLEDDREEIDIHELNRQIAGIVARQNELRTAIDAIVADLEEKR